MPTREGTAPQNQPEVPDAPLPVLSPARPLPDGLPEESPPRVVRPLPAGLPEDTPPRRAMPSLVDDSDAEDLDAEDDEALTPPMRIERVVSPQPGPSNAVTPPPRRRPDGGPQPREGSPPPRVGYRRPDGPLLIEGTLDEAEGDPLLDDARLELEEVKFYELELYKEKILKKNMAKEVIYQIKIKDNWRNKRIKDVMSQLRKMFDDLIKKASEGLLPDDFIRLYLNQRNLYKPIVLPPTRVNQVNAERMIRNIEGVLQSEENLTMDDSLEMHIATVKVPRVGTKVPVMGSQSVSQKRSMVRIKNTDQMCMARALVVCRAKKEKDPEYNKMRQSTCKLQKQKAEALHELAGVSTTRACTFFDLPEFERVLGYQVVVFSGAQNNEIVYVGAPKERGVLYLYQSYESDEEFENGGVGHIDAIVNIQGFMGYKFFCETCKKGYWSKQSHSCASHCSVCGADHCELVNGKEIKCDSCNKTCRSQKCYDSHKVARPKQTKSNCLRYWKCPKCHKSTGREREELHVCGEYMCSNCKEYVEGRHMCYMRAVERKKCKLRQIVYDFECRQDTGDHIPNFCCVHTTCDRCEHSEVELGCSGCGTRCIHCGVMKNGRYIKPPCVGCGKREKVFSGEDTTQAFCKWLFTDHNKGSTVIAHNAKGYDLYFVLHYLVHSVTNPKLAPQIVFSGSKVMYMYLKHLDIRCIDSLNFFPMRLSALPKAFGISELKKGYFPHYMNVPENYTYIGPHPDPEMYGASQMMPWDRDKLLKFLEENKQQQFNFAEHMKSYCRSDVDILRRSCLKFREMFMKITSGVNARGETVALDPFDYITIASVCMSVYRSMFLPETHMAVTVEEHEIAEQEGRDPVPKEVIKKGGVFYLNDEEVDVHSSKFVKSPIALVPPGGYAHRGNTSRGCAEWMLWQESQLGRHIEHARSSEGERTLYVGGHAYRADGYIEESKTILEYDGCYYHGCPRCYYFGADGESYVDPTTQHSSRDRYNQTLHRRKLLEEAGYTVLSIWEHDWERLKKDDPEIREYVERLRLPERLDPHDAFYGGRTNASALHATASLPKRILYKDMTSMYPTVNKFCTYPKGHPRVILNDFGPISSYFGIAKVKLLAPRKLFHPVIPYRHQKKLFFPLCRRCTELNSQDPCHCSDEQRAITGTWVTLEIQKAVEKGYQVLEIYEVYQFDETCPYDVETMDNKLFTEYVNTFLKFKLEASGWPEHCTDEESKLKYLEFILRKEGLELDANNMEVNKGLRSLAKLMLNSFWGKFGQRNNFRQTTITRSVKEFYKLFFSSNKTIADFHILNEDTAQIDWAHHDDCIPINPQTNVFVAAFTTAHARLMLYEVLEKLDEQVVYYDTDSVIYVHEPGQYDHPCGEGLGEFTDELVCPEVGCSGCTQGHYIVDFWSAGPKNYAYRVDTGHQVCINCIHFVNKKYVQFYIHAHICFQVCKVRGFTLNYENSKHINLGSFREIIESFVEGDPQHITVTEPSKITRDKLKQRLYNREQSKKYGMIYDKRVINKDTWITYPYGY